VASAVVAALVGGLNVTLVVVAITGVAGPAGREGQRPIVMGGALATLCLNCLSVPVCLVGASLAVVGLVAHRRDNPLFAWVGLCGNAAVVLAVLGYYLLALLSGH
jgi:hypothetical protein